MNGIIGMLDLALETRLDREQREYLGLVKNSAEHLLTLINDILDFSKIEAGKLDMQETDFDLIDLIGETLKTLAPRVAMKDLELTYDLAKDIPRFVRGDPYRLRQILVNLLGNAVKFTERGAVGLQLVSCSPIQSSRTICLEFAIHDTGVGIDADKLDQIFLSFTQGDNQVARKFGGTGLGLSISKQLVEMMGGEIRVESIAGQGSRFIFRVFLRIADAPEEITRREASLGGKRALLVDDNAINLRVFSLMLDHLHMRHDAVTNGEHGLAALAEAAGNADPYDIVMLDARMPGMDGFEVAGKIRASGRHANTTLMMLTSTGVRGDASRCRELGLDAYLTKPVSLGELRGAIEASLIRAEDDTRLITRHSLREARPRLNILVVEDNLVNQKLAVKMLQREGHATSVAENGRLALAALERERFDLILMDMMMPEMDGLEAARRIRAQEAVNGGHIPIIALTANAMQGDRERCLDAGMDSYLAKPVKAEALYREVQKLTEVPSVAGIDQSQIDSLPVHDVDEALGRLEDEELYISLMEMFVADAPGYLSDLRDALATEDWPRLTRVAHSLKGILATFSAKRAEWAARQLELAGPQADAEISGRWLHLIETEVGTFLAQATDN
jgi:two-component system, sensor histidine kinase and response regulator